MSKQKIAELAGIAESQVKDYGIELQVLRSQGLLVDINVTGLSLFDRTARLDEMGMQAGDVREKRMKPGRKSTLPVRTEIQELSSITASTRQLLKKYSRSVPGFYPYAWISFQAFPVFKARFLEYKARFEAVVARLADRLDGYRDELAELSAQEARQAWRTLSGAGYAAVYAEGKVYTSEDDYVDAQINRDLANLPDAEMVLLSVKMDYVIGMMWTDTDFHAIEANAELLQAQAHEARQRAIREQMEQGLVQEKFRHEQALNWEKEDRLREARERILAEEMAHVRRQLAEQGSPLDEVVKAMRINAAESAREMLVGIRKAGFIHGKVAEKGKGLKEYFDIMATHDDGYLRDILTALDKEMSKAAGDRKIEQVTDLLEEIDALARQEVKTILTSGGRFAAIEA